MAGDSCGRFGSYTKCNQNYLESKRTLISENKRVALCGCGNKIIVFGLKTGKYLRKLESHGSKIVDFYFRKTNSLQVISAAEDGSIILWDYTDGTIIKKLTLPYSICSMLLHPTQDDVIFVTKENSLEQSEEKQNGNRRHKNTLLKVDLNITKKRHKGALVGEAICSCNTDSKLTSLASHGDYVAYLKEKKLQIYSVAEKKMKKFKYGGSAFTCIAFHPTKLMVATGNSQGKIILWQDFTGDNTPITTELHWHAHAVEDLSFTHDGMYLVSGGVEAVLVTWQLETLSKDFTPRFGAPIKHIAISADDTLVAVTLTNNVVKIVSTVEKHLSCLLQGYAKATDSTAGMTYDPRTECLVLPGAPAGHLQFYQQNQDSVLMTMDVVGHNYLAGVESKSSYHSDIENFSVSYDGKWLATVERGSYKVIPDEVKLKFWLFDVASQRYQLNTIAEPPHDDDIVDMKMRPEPESSAFDQLAVTSGSSGKFKIWTLMTHKDQDGNSDHLLTWNCHAVCYYGNSPCGNVAFSEDGSLLAVIYDKTVTIWSAELGNLETCLHCPVQNECIRDIVFGCGSSAAYLLARTDHYLICWNLLTCSVWWSLEAQVSCMAADPSTGLFAVFALFKKHKRKLFLFDASSPKPVRDLGRMQNDEKSLYALFTGGRRTKTPQDNQNMNFGELYFFTDQKNVYKISSDNEDPKQELSQQEVTEEEIQSEFDNIFGFNTNKSSEVKIVKQNRNIPQVISSQVIQKILTTPSHVLPPVASLCSAFFTSLSLSTPSKERNAEHVEDENESEGSEADGGSSDEESQHMSQRSANQELEHSRADDQTITKLVNFEESICFDWLSPFVKQSYVQ